GAAAPGAAVARDEPKAVVQRDGAAGGPPAQRNRDPVAPVAPRLAVDELRIAPRGKPVAAVEAAEAVVELDVVGGLAAVQRIAVEVAAGEDRAAVDADARPGVVRELDLFHDPGPGVVPADAVLPPAGNDAVLEREIAGGSRRAGPGAVGIDARERAGHAADLEPLHVEADVVGLDLDAVLAGNTDDIGGEV